MKTFSEVIQEDVRFASGTNQNYTGRSGKNDHTVVFFSKDTKKAYQERGQKTHGKMSHSIKHYGEFNLNSYMALAGEIKSTIRQLFDDGKGDYIELHSQSGKSETNPDKVFKQANATSWLNAVDAVQDVAETNGNLTPVERVLLNFGKRLSKMYETEIEARLRSAVDLDKIEDETKLETILKGTKVVKFGAWQNNRPVYMYLDLQDNVVIIARGQTIATAFKFDNPASDYKGVIKNFYRKWMATRLEMDNHVLYRVMSAIGRS